MFLGLLGGQRIGRRHRTAVLLPRLLVQLLEPVELRREAALAGRVDDEHDLALELVERERLALLVERLEGVYVCCGHGGKAAGVRWC
jgi:hypothetical protein